MRRNLPRFFVFAAAVAWIAFASQASAQLTYNPVATTGFDIDVIIEAGLNDGEIGANEEFGSRQFYEAGIATYVEGTHKVGLSRVTSGVVLPVSGSTINFGFAPFEENNGLKFVSTTVDPKSLTLTTPASFGNLAIVHGGGSLGTTNEWGLLSYTINYQGGATQTGTVTTADWGNATLPTGTEVLIRTGRLNAGATGMNPWPLTPEGEAPTSNPERWRFYVSEVATTSTAAITSIEFSNPLLQPHTAGVPNGDPIPLNTGDDVVVWGIAGATGGGSTFNAADFNHLNGVDAADLGIWKGGYASGTTNAQGNADGDGDVDGNDFLVWQRNLGATSVSGVPEPSAAVLAVIGVLAIRRRRR